VLTLGTLAFNTYASLRKIKGLKFIHAASYDLTDIILIASYHPSRQNTQTGRLKWNEWIDVFRKINDVIN